MALSWGIETKWLRASLARGEATNQTIFREMNEWKEEATDARLGIDRPFDTYICECSDLDVRTRSV